MHRENEYTEFKKTTGELKEGVISICSILNKNGDGELYFGFKNDGTLVGQQISEKTLRDISQAISSHLEPKIFPVITHETKNDKDFVKVIFSGTDAPYYASHTTLTAGVPGFSVSVTNAAKEAFCIISIC
jgi:ATP-dependent DNA helicase RecG